jgi:hypothetical protein
MPGTLSRDSNREAALASPALWEFDSLGCSDDGTVVPSAVAVASQQIYDVIMQANIARRISGYFMAAHPLDAIKLQNLCVPAVAEAAIQLQAWTRKATLLE